jgi:hypothetical protein
VSSKKLKVKDMNGTLREACINRGYSLEDELTPWHAVEEWSAWELGDPSWANLITSMYLDHTKKAER